MGFMFWKLGRLGLGLSNSDGWGYARMMRGNADDRLELELGKR